MRSLQGGRPGGKGTEKMTVDTDTEKIRIGKTQTWESTETACFQGNIGRLEDFGKLKSGITV